MKLLIRIDRGNFKILRKKTLEKDVWKASVAEFGRAVCRNIMKHKQPNKCVRCSRI